MHWLRIYRPNRATHKQVWQLAWPMMLSNITVPLLGLVDTAVMGHLPDPRYLAAIAVGGMLFTVVYWTFGFLRMGTTGLVAQSFGREDGDAIRRYLMQSLLIATTLGLLIWLLRQPLIELALQLAGAAPDVIEEARRYAQIRAWGAPAVLCNFVLLGWFVGNQNTRIPLLLLTITNLLNILLNLLLVFGLGMRAEGVALGTVIAEYTSLLLGLWLCRGLLQRTAGQFQWPALLRLADYVALFHVNRYLFVRTLLLLFCFAFFTAQGARMGTDIVAANAVLLNFLVLISNALDGYAHATEALAGRALGRQKRREFYTLILSATLWSLISAGLMTLFFWLAGDLLIHALTGLPEVRETASRYLPWLIALPLLAVWSFLLDGVFIGTTQVKAMQNTMIISVLLMFLPLWWLSQPLGNHGLWLAFCSLFLARGITGGYVYWQLVRHNRWGLPPN
ncbi:DNA-damage-inducible protein F [Nitrincola lacisaponensis]|uniref:DNA-damage-inducible protein F n=1 Tax=Nitrincola lacisaponensis TaxID=267850 RepID=A0A063Y4X9_9GAMM|nr:MATE family efflux transporter [Nitrincola lacisaponensis]KDE41378.1 DNA-damage-inducible protein F [Nitrincola lacisaponensis]